jgi:hypothetical protein
MRAEEGKLPDGEEGKASKGDVKEGQRQPGRAFAPKDLCECCGVSTVPSEHSHAYHCQPRVCL